MIIAVVRVIGNLFADKVSEQYALSYSGGITPYKYTFVAIIGRTPKPR